MNQKHVGLISLKIHMGLKLKGKQYLAQCVQGLVKLKTFEKPFGILNDFKIHLGLPIHVGIVTKPSSIVVQFKHSINMFQFSKGLIRIHFIDCLLFAINKVANAQFPPFHSQEAFLGVLSREIPMSAKSPQAMSLRLFKLEFSTMSAIHIHFSAAVDLH